MKRFLIIFLFSVLASFLISSAVEAKTDTAAYGQYVCERHGSIETCNAHFSADNVHFQMYKTLYSGYTDGFGGQGASKITVCLDEIPDRMWKGPCWITYDDPELDNDSLSLYDIEEIGLGDWNYRDFNYANYEIYVRDAIVAISPTVWGRTVSIDEFYSSVSEANVNQEFTVSWKTDQVADGPKLFWDGPVVSTDGSNSGDTVSPENSRTFKGTGSGTAYFTICASGPGHNGYTTECTDGSGTDGSGYSHLDSWTPDDITVTIGGGVSSPGAFDLSGTCSAINSSTNQANLSWTTSSNAEKYQVWHGEWSNQATQRYLGETTGTTFSDTVSNAIDYYYRVKAVNSVGEKIATPDWLFVCGVAAPSGSYTLIVNRTAGGSVTSSPAGISCGLDCSENYTDGTTVVLSASASSGYTFNRWEGEGCTGNGTCSVVMNANRSVKAFFVSDDDPTPSGSCIDNTSTSFVTPIPDTLTPGQTINFTVAVENTGDTWWYHGSAYQFAQLSSFTLNPSYGHLPQSSLPGNTTNWTFSLTAPSTPGSYILSMRMKHRAGWEYKLNDGTVCGTTPIVDTYFGQTTTANFAVSAANNLPVGNLETVNNNCDIIGGWAFDPDNSSDPIYIKIYTDNPAPSGTLIYNELTTGLRPDVNAAYGITGDHGFTFFVPSSLKDAQNHSIYAYGVDVDTGELSLLWNSPTTINCTILNAPTNLTVDNSTCNQLRLTWTDNAQGENGYIIKRSVSPGAEVEIDRITPNQTSYLDSPPATNTTYYYKVQAYKNNPSQTSPDSNEASGFNVPCVSNLGTSTKTLTKINGQAYSSSTVINNNDTLTFQITVINTGSIAATVNYICEIPSSNIVNLRNLSVTGGGSNGGITLSSPSCNNGPRLNVSGTKPVGNPNWVITFDATFVKTTSDPFEICSNSGVIYFSDDEGNKTKTVNFGPNLCKTGRGTVPNFREVAP